MSVLMQVFLKFLFCSNSESFLKNENWTQFLFNNNRLKKSACQGVVGWSIVDGQAVRQGWDWIPCRGDWMQGTKKIHPFNTGPCAYVDNVHLEFATA